MKNKQNKYQSNAKRNGASNPSKQSKRNGKPYKDYIPEERDGLTSANSPAGNHNDPSWYNRIPALVEATGNIVYSNFTGIPFDVQGNMESVWPKGYTLPGIMTLDFDPAYGVSESRFSGINVVSNKVYADMRRDNSGARNYEATDYMMHFMALDSALMLWATAVRAYGIISMYLADNRYTPHYLGEALGLDIDDLSKNRSNFLARIDQFGQFLNTCAIPKDLYVILRHVYMCSNLYMDNSNTKSQIYAFKPRFIYKLDTTTYDTGTALVPESFPGNMGYDDFISMFDLVTDTLLNEKDFSLMTGDTFHAFKDLWTINPVPSTYITPLVHDIDMLAQIHNADIVGVPFGTDEDGREFDIIYQTDGATIICRPACNPILTAYRGNTGDVTDLSAQYTHMTDWHGDKAPSPLENIYINRLKVAWSDMEPGYILGTPTSNGVCRITACGTEIVRKASIYQYDAETDTLRHTDINGIREYNASILASTLDIAQFDWHPCIWVGQFREETGSIVLTNFLWETKNIGTCSSDNIRAMHDTANYSLFNLTLS